MIAHRSGGPLYDFYGEGVFLAKSIDEYVVSLETVLNMSNSEFYNLSKITKERSRKSFSHNNFIYLLQGGIQNCLQNFDVDFDRI